MKRVVLLTSLLLPLAACSGLLPGTTAPGPALSAQSVKLLPFVAAIGRVLWCSDSKQVNCLRLNTLQARIGGSMTPSGDFQMVFSGEKALPGVLGQSFAFTFPPGGSSKFFIGTLTLTVDGDLDKTLHSRTSSCTLEALEDLGQNVYRSVYACT